MARTKFMQRVLSAMENKESEVIDQIQKDIEIALEDGSINTEEYDISVSDDKVLLLDKVNNETTEILGNAPDYYMKEYIIEQNNSIPQPESINDTDNSLDINTSVKWVNELGEDQVGILTEINGDLATINQDGVSIVVPVGIISPVDVYKQQPENKVFAKFTDDGNLIMRLGNYDIQVDIDNEIVLVLDENITFTFDSKAPINKAMKDIKSQMKKAGLKKFSDTAKTFSEDQVYSNKFSKFSPAVAKMFASLGSYQVVVFDGADGAAEGDEDKYLIMKSKIKGAPIMDGIERKSFDNSEDADKYISELKTKYKAEGKKCKQIPTSYFEKL